MQVEPFQVWSDGNPQFHASRRDYQRTYIGEKISLVNTVDVSISEHILNEIVGVTLDYVGEDTYPTWVI